MTPEEAARKPGFHPRRPGNGGSGQTPRDKWSAAEILEHLDRSYTGSAKAFERCLDQKKPSSTKATLKDRIAALAVVRFGYLPQGRQAPTYTLPKGVAAAELPGLIERHLAELDDLISRCEQQFGENAKLLDHPFIGPLSGRQWRKFHLVHGRHHIKQIKALRAQPL